MTELSHCPKCNTSLDGEDIYQFFFNKYSKEGIPDYIRNIVEIKKAIKDYPSLYKNAPSLADLKKMTPLEFAAWQTAQSYGWSKEKPVCFRKEIGIEIQGVYDGIAKWRCPNCKHEWARFPWAEKYLTNKI